MASVSKKREEIQRNLEKRIVDVYKQAIAENQETLLGYINGWDEVVDGKTVHHDGMFERRDKERVAYQKGAYGQYGTKEASDAFNAWWASQEGRRDYWINACDKMTDRIVQSQKISQAYINGEIPKVFTMSNNQVAVLAEKSAMELGVTGIAFDLVDEYTIRRLLNGDDSALIFKDYEKVYDRLASYEDWWARKEIDEKARFKTLYVECDIAKEAQWDRKKLQNALTVGIISGDNVYQMARRFQSVANMSKTTAIRNARTAMTRAYNAGAQDRWDDLSKQGVVSMKKWIDVHDSVPPERNEHWKASGQEVPYDEPFVVGGEQLMYPGDTSLGASGWNVYNCRCTSSTCGFDFKSVLSEEDRKKANIVVTDDMIESVNADEATVETEYEKTFREIVGRKPTEKEMNYSDDDFSYYFLTGKFPENNVKNADFKNMSISDMKKYAENNLETRIENLDGVKHDYAEQTLEVLTKFEEKIGGSLDGLKVHFGDVRDNALAHYDNKKNTLYLKKSGNLEEKSKKQNEQHFEKYGKIYHATTTYSGTIWHELGHAIDFSESQALSKMLSDDEHLSRISVMISDYAGHSGGIGSTKRSEAFAENFAAYMDGGENSIEVPEEIVDIIESYFRSKRGF